MSQRNRTHRVYVDSACITTYIGDASIFIYTYVSTYVCISTLTSVSVLYRSTYILRDRQTDRQRAHRQEQRQTAGGPRWVSVNLLRMWTEQEAEEGGICLSCSCLTARVWTSRPLCPPAGTYTSGSPSSWALGLGGNHTGSSPASSMRTADCRASRPL